MARANAFWPTAAVGEADSVISVSASACHIGGPKGVSPGQKPLLHGTNYVKNKYVVRNDSHMNSSVLRAFFLRNPNFLAVI